MTPHRSKIKTNVAPKTIAGGESPTGNMDFLPTMHKALNKILFVEDEPDIQYVACLALESVGGFTVKACASGKEALQLATNFMPDLILLDVMMPEMDGVTTLQLLRKLPGCESIPAIFLTAKTRAQDVEQLKRAGALDIVPKPFDPMTLSRTVLEIWQRR